MNLHDVKNNLTILLWTCITGGNGHTIGTHLYEYEQEPVPERPDPMPIRTRDHQWNPPNYFAWAPWRITTRFPLTRDWGRRGSIRNFERPICGFRSRSTQPDYSFAWQPYGDTWRHRDTWGPCAACVTEANRRGMIPKYQQAALLENERFVTIRGEYDLWRNG